MSLYWVLFFIGFISGGATVTLSDQYDYWLDVSPKDYGIIDFGTTMYRADAWLTKTVSWRLGNTTGSLIYIYPLLLYVQGTVEIIMLDSESASWTFTGTSNVDLGSYPVIRGPPGSVAQVTYTPDPGSPGLYVFAFRYFGVSEKANNSTEHVQVSYAYTELSQLRLQSETTTYHIKHRDVRSPTTVRIVLVYTNMVDTPDCGRDALEIYDGESGPLLLRTCRSRASFTPMEVITTVREAFIRLSCSNAPDEECAIINYMSHKPHADMSPSDAVYHINQEWNENITTIYADTTKLHEAGFRLNVHHLLLTVEASHSASVLLQRYRHDFHRDVFEIVLDADNQTKAVIRSYRKDKPHKSPEMEVVKYLTYRQLDPDYHRNFWISWNDNYVRVGSGTSVGYGEIIRSDKFPDVQHNVNYVSVGTGPGSNADWAITTACDNNFMFPFEDYLDTMISEISHTFDNASAGSVYWRISKFNQYDRLTLTVTSNSLQATGDCILERVSIYKGGCPNEANLVGYFCGPSRDTFSQTDHVDTLIHFTTRHKSLPPGHERDFVISYNVEDYLNYPKVSSVSKSLMAEPPLDQWGNPTYEYAYNYSYMTQFPWPDAPPNVIDPFHDVLWIEVDPPSDYDGPSAASVVKVMAFIIGFAVLGVSLCACGGLLVYNRSKRRRGRVMAQPPVDASQPTHSANQYASAQGYSNSIAPASTLATNSPASQTPTYIYETKYVSGVPPPAVYIPPYEQVYRSDDQHPPPSFDQASAPPPPVFPEGQTIPGPYGNVPANHAQTPAPGTYPIPPLLPLREQRKDSCI